MQAVRKREEASHMPTVLVTGANRGIGYEFVRQYAFDGWRVIAAMRDAAHGIKDLERLAAERRAEVEIAQVDVAEPKSVAALAKRYDGAPIDLLINNAALLTADTGPSGVIQALDAIDYDHWTFEFRVNAQGPLAMANAFAEHLAAGDGKTIVNMTSGMGSVSNTDAGGFYYYRSSKAALNMITRALSVDLGHRDIIVIGLDPGWVQTRMGGPNATISPEESVTALRRVIAGATPGMSGRVFNRLGEERQP